MAAAAPPRRSCRHFRRLGPGGLRGPGGRGLSSLPGFTQPVDRTAAGHSLKWGLYDKDVLPMWIADMDFQSPDCVRQALRARVDHGVFGYTDMRADAYVQPVLDYLARAHSAEGVEKEHLTWLPGLVPGLNFACQTTPEPGDEVLVLTPVYPPFLSAAGNAGRKTVRVPLLPPSSLSSPAGHGELSWRPDFEAMEAAVTAKTRMLLLCNPHNPVGKAFTAAEVAGLLGFCDRHDLILVSDEIHCDLVLPDSNGARHTAVVSFSGSRAAERAISLHAPSKTYNTAGLGVSYAIIRDREVRTTFRRRMRGVLPEISALGLEAAKAVYTPGGGAEEWRQALLARLVQNRSMVAAAVAGWDGVEMEPPEATYLAWIDFTRLELQDPAAYFRDRAGVGLSDGQAFGARRGWLRMNFGAAPAVVAEGLRRMAAVMPAPPAR
eukprot:SAG22_NODE_270_length_13234_cov_13.248573_5_plen_435_part_00